VPGNAFADDVIAACGADASAAGHAIRNVIQAWLAKANQTQYAQLARVVLQHGDSNDTARAILLEAGRQVELMGHALDAGGTLPIALCGGLAVPLRPYLPAAFAARLVAAQGDSAAGALRLIQTRLED
jgi:glucosamine kinase